MLGVAIPLLRVCDLSGGVLVVCSWAVNGSGVCCCFRWSYRVPARWTSWYYLGLISQHCRECAWCMMCDCMCEIVHQLAAHVQLCSDDFWCCDMFLSSFRESSERAMMTSTCVCANGGAWVKHLSPYDWLIDWWTSVLVWFSFFLSRMFEFSHEYMMLCVNVVISYHVTWTNDTSCCLCPPVLGCICINKRRNVSS